MLKHPTDEDWAFVKTCALNTIGKKATTLPTDEWKKKILRAEHSPIRTLWFAFEMHIPSWVSVHYVRHNVGCSHFVQSQRNDRQSNYDRNKAPQDAEVSHIMVINAQALINMAHKRLCGAAATETRTVMREIVKLVLQTNPEFKEMLVPQCVYKNGKCDEFYPCGYNGGRN